jgi:hypothetical protein
MRQVAFGLVLFICVVGGWFAKAEAQVVHYGPIPSTSPDSGTCGNFWANDDFDRVFRVRTTPNPDGTFEVQEQFQDGSFVTVAGPSPGGCDTNPGGTVSQGLTGRMGGSFSILVAGGVFNPDAVCTEESCGTTAGFIATVFGPTAVFAITSFHLQYHVPHHGNWRNASADRGGNHGDITSGTTLDSTP